MDDRPYLTVAQIAARLQVSEELVRRALRQGDLRGVRFGKSAGWRVSEAALAAWLERHAGGETMTTPTIGDRVWRKMPQGAAGAAGVILSQEGILEEVAGTMAGVRWLDKPDTGAQYRRELDWVPRAKLAKATPPAEPED